MNARRSRALLVGVIASREDLERAVGMRRPPDLFELRLDRLTAIVDRLAKTISKLRPPLIITARHPHEGGAGKLSLRQRRALLTRFLPCADYVDVELRSAGILQLLPVTAGNKKVRRIISIHNFKSTPAVRVLRAGARAAKAHRADIFKVATRTDSPVELGRLLDFLTKSGVNLPLAVMGIGKLGAISRVLLARAGSALIYGSLGESNDVEGQLSLKQLRQLGIAGGKDKRFRDKNKAASRGVTRRS
jgi:3-dehydroquinate dehydratase-1